MMDMLRELWRSIRRMRAGEHFPWRELLPFSVSALGLYLCLLATPLVIGALASCAAQSIQSETVHATNEGAPIGTQLDDTELDERGQGEAETIAGDEAADELQHGGGTRRAPDPFEHDEPPESEGWPDLPPPSLDGRIVSNGRSISNMNAQECMRRIRALGVEFESASHEAVEMAVKPSGSVGGVEIEFTGRREQGRIMDCRLVLAIAAWAPTLRSLGVVRIRHLSALRPGARVASTGRASGHSRGYAFDPRFFDIETDGGTVTFDVLNDWEDRRRGGALCEEKDESIASASMRAAVCKAIEHNLFQVVVSPHHNDAHQNHLHLEVVPGAGWTWSG